MIIIEKVELNGREFTHTHSDAYRIRQVETGNIYDSADDIEPCHYTYEETDEALPVEEIDDATALGIITGGAS